MDNENIKLNDTDAEQVAGGAGAPYIYYRVVRGDNLTKIAHKFHTDIPTIMSLNPIIENPNFIREGWMLQIPRYIG